MKFSAGLQRRMAEVRKLLQERDELIRLLENCIRTMEAHGCGGTVDAVAARDYLNPEIREGN